MHIIYLFRGTFWAVKKFWSFWFFLRLPGSGHFFCHGYQNCFLRVERNILEDNWSRARGIGKLQEKKVYILSEWDWYSVRNILRGKIIIKCKQFDINRVECSKSQKNAQVENWLWNQETSFERKRCADTNPRTVAAIDMTAPNWPSILCWSQLLKSPISPENDSLFSISSHTIINV